MEDLSSQFVMTSTYKRPKKALPFAFIVNWENDGFAIRNNLGTNGKLCSAIRNPSYYFKRGIAYSFST
jgi:hypothetical protein